MKKIIVIISLLLGLVGCGQNPSKFRSGIDVKGVVKVDFDGVLEDTALDSILTWTGAELKWVTYSNLFTKINAGILDDLPPSTNPLPLNYSVIWTGTGLVFNAAASRYYIVDTYYSATAAQITLDAADATNDRIDLIVADTSGVISKITGTPSASPAEPNYDLATQFPLKFILVSAGGTVPDGVSNTLVYDENVGSAGGEWDSENTLSYQPYQKAAEQNQVLLNNQFNTKINKIKFK